MTMANDMTTKDWIQYSSAMAMIISGIVLSFLSFFQSGDISDGVLWYMAQALTYAGSIFGVSIYFKNKLGAFESRAKSEIAEALYEAEQRGERMERSKKQESGIHVEPNDLDPLENSVL